MSDKEFVCRCEDVTVEDVREAIDSGITCLEELKRVLRVGMGPCQGRTCGPVLQSMLARALNVGPGEISSWNKRPPLKPVASAAFFKES